jgi:membrane-associated protease RseP (regulator of RpoE activity)
MGRIWRLTALAVGAALLGLAASALVGAHLCRVMSTAEITSAAGAQAQPPPCDSPSCAKDDSAEPQDEPRSAETVDDPRTDADHSASAAPLPAKRRRARAGRRRASAAAADDTLLHELGRGITKLGQRRYQIKASALARALGNLRWLPGAARVAPDVRDGKPFGFRIVWVKPGGPIAQLGLRNGDILVSVNGLDITTPDHALEAYGKLKAARRLVLGIVRDGQRATLEYVIR